MTTEVQKKSDEQRLPRFTPDVDLIDRKGAFELRADMPGVGNEDLDLNVEDYVLRISGIARSEAPEEYQSALREFQDREYHIAYRLSSEIDLEEIKAKMENGVLVVHLPKRKEHQPRKIKVDVE